MAITILTSPPALALSGNPMVFKVQTSNYYNIAAASSVMIISALPGLTADTDFSIDFDYGSQAVSAISSLSATDAWNLPPSQWHILPRGSTLPGETTVSTYAKFLNRMANISPYWIVTEGTGGDIVFTARQAGTYEIVSLTDIGGQWVLDEINSTLGGDPEIDPYVYLITKVFVEREDGTGYELIGEDEQHFLTSDTINVNVAQFLNPYMRNQSEEALIATAALNELLKVNKRYYVSFTEFRPRETVDPELTTLSNVLKVHKGGLKKNEFLNYPNVIADYFLASDTAALSWNSKVFELVPDEWQNLYFLNTSAEDQLLTITVSGVYESTLGMEFTMQEITMPGFSSYKIKIPYPDTALDWPVGFEREGLLQMNIKITANGNTDQYVFKLSESRANERHIYYENSFGCLEQIKVFGTTAYGVNTIKEEVNKPVDSVTGDYVTLSRTKGYEEVFETSTGPLGADQSIALVELLNSDNVFLRRGDELMRILIEAGETNLYTDDGYPHGFPFKFRIAEKNFHFSRIVNVTT